MGAVVLCGYSGQVERGTFRHCRRSAIRVVGAGGSARMSWNHRSGRSSAPSDSTSSACVAASRSAYLFAHQGSAFPSCILRTGARPWPARLIAGSGVIYLPLVYGPWPPWATGPRGPPLLDPPGGGALSEKPLRPRRLHFSPGFSTLFPAPPGLGSQAKMNMHAG